MSESKKYDSIKAITNFRKLSEGMKDILMECHENELLHLEPFEASLTKHAKGLIARGMLEVKEHFIKGGKKIYGLFVTDSGRDYLKKI